MRTTVVYETHSWSNDNDVGNASGWSHGALSPRGRDLAAELGSRRRADDLDVVLVSDLRRAVETAEIAFAGSAVPVLHDWRLRECDFGELNGQPAARVHAAVTSAHDRYPGGESWADAVRRVGGVLDDIGTRWPGRRVLVIGHMSAYWALEHHVHHLPLESIGRDFQWQEGWEFELPA
jgi:broad specificity phosphatase PhoE